MFPHLSCVDITSWATGVLLRNFWLISVYWSIYLTSSFNGTKCWVLNVIVVLAVFFFGCKIRARNLISFFVCVCVCPVFLVSFAEKDILMHIFNIFVENYVSGEVWIYFCIIHSAPLICLFCSLPCLIFLLTFHIIPWYQVWWSIL